MEPGAAADLGLRFDLTVPLARFYATHRSELPDVFRSIQIAPVWRAERPQKGRYRQFTQCDIDVLGEPSTLAEIELITATAAAIDDLGIEGTSIRINDRRVLLGLLDACGFEPADPAGALVTIDKLDKIGIGGVAAELRDAGAGDPDRLVAALEATLAASARSASAPTGSGAGPARLGAEVFDATLAALPPRCLGGGRRPAGDQGGRRGGGARDRPGGRPHPGPGHGLLHRTDLRVVPPFVLRLGRWWGPL